MPEKRKPAKATQVHPSERPAYEPAPVPAGLPPHMRQEALDEANKYLVNWSERQLKAQIVAYRHPTEGVDDHPEYDAMPMSQLQAAYLEIVWEQHNDDPDATYPGWTGSQEGWL